MPVANPLNVAVALLPVRVAPPGEAVTVHALVGRLLNATLPVALWQVGCVIAPTAGVPGIVFIVAVTAVLGVLVHVPLEALT